LLPSLLYDRIIENSNSNKLDELQLNILFSFNNLFSYFFLALTVHLGTVCCRSPQPTPPRGASQLYSPLRTRYERYKTPLLVCCGAGALILYAKHRLHNRPEATTHATKLQPTKIKSKTQDERLRDIQERSRAAVPEPEHDIKTLEAIRQKSYDVVPTDERRLFRKQTTKDAISDILKNDITKALELNVGRPLPIQVVGYKRKIW